MIPSDKSNLEHNECLEKICTALESLSSTGIDKTQALKLNGLRNAISDLLDIAKMLKFEVHYKIAMETLAHSLPSTVDFIDRLTKWMKIFKETASLSPEKLDTWYRNQRLTIIRYHGSVSNYITSNRNLDTTSQ